MTIYLLYTCDIWKSSKYLYGVYSDEDILKRDILELINDGDAKINEGCPIEDELSEWTTSEMHDFIDYIAIEETELNEKL